MTPHHQSFATLASAFILACTASADWSTSATAPTTLAGGVGEQSQPKILPIPSGGFYMSFYSSTGLGYDMMLARFDSAGNAVWGAPVMVADLSQSSTQDYGFAVDEFGNAGLAFRDDRTPVVQITAAKITLAGSASWGPGGAQMTANTADSSNSPKMCSLVGGKFGVGWTQGNKATVQRVSATGGKEWLIPYTMSDGTTAGFTCSDVKDDGAGNIIVAAVRAVGFSGAKVLHAQKLSPLGVAMWTSPTAPVFSTGSLQFGNSPPFIADGSGGAIFCYYLTGPLQSWVQRLGGATGARMFGTNGSSVTSTTTNERVSPTAVWDQSANRIYASWSEHVASTSMFGIGVQSFDGTTGARQWGNLGVMAAEMETVYSYTWAATGLTPSGPVVFFNRSTAAVNSDVRAQRFNAQGVAQWSTPTTLAQNTASAYRLVTSRVDGEGSVLLWEGGDTGTNDLLGARVGDDGVLGPAPVSNPADRNGDNLVDGVDLGLVLAAFASSDPVGDADQSGLVDGSDLAIVLAGWGG